MAELFSDEGIPTRAVLTMTVVPLPRCPRCGAMHPLAVNKHADPNVCHECGGPVGTGAVQVVPATLGGVHGFLASCCFKIADKLAALARRLDR